MCGIFKSDFNPGGGNDVSRAQSDSNDKCEFVFAKVIFQRSGYDQNTLYTCIKFPKNKLKIYI